MRALLVVTILVASAVSTAANARCFLASHYGFEAGSRTASGERLNLSDNTAAHPSLPFGTILMFKDRDGRPLPVRVNDRGPFHGKRNLDVNSGVARRMGWSGVRTICEH
jgi:rare lipoprotein A